MNTEDEIILLKKALVDEKIKNENLKKENAELLKFKESFDVFLESTPDYVYIKNTKHQFLFASEPFAQLTGHKSRHEIYGKTDFDIFPLKDAEVYYKEQKKVIESGKRLLGIDEPYHNKEGKLGWINTSKIPLYDSKGNISGLIGMSRDITKLKELEIELKKQAQFDNLTALYNRHKLDEALIDEKNRANRFSSQFGVIIMDLDYFKDINDTYGHQAGDTVLQEVSKLLKTHSRKTDTVGRWGGEEFLIICSETDIDGVKNLADKLKEIIASYPFSAVKQQTASFGISMYQKDGKIEELIKRADEALYKAKNAGRNRVEIT